MYGYMVCRRVPKALDTKGEYTFHNSTKTAAALTTGPDVLSPPKDRGQSTEQASKLP